MQVKIAELPSGQFLELSNRANAQVIALTITPHGQRRSPETLARQRPVDVAFQPLAKPSVADVLGYPLDRLVELDHAFAEIGCTDVPGVLGVINDRVARPPAERIVVYAGLSTKHHAPVFEFANQHFIGVLEELAGHWSDFRQEVPVQAHAVQHRQAMFLPELEVIDTVCRRRMHNARAVFCGDKVGWQHLERIGFNRQVLEQLLVAHADKLGSFYCLRDLMRQITKNCLSQVCCQNQCFAFCLNIDIVHVRMHGESKVGR